MWTLMYRRNDGSFVVRLANGWPYHVEDGDPIFAAVQGAAEGVDLPPEPVPEPIVLPAAPVPMKADLMAKLLALQSQIEALADDEGGGE